MDTRPELDMDYMSDESVLKCPSCKELYLHQHTTTVYDRPFEDGPVIRTAVDGGKTELSILPADTNENPSSRRDGIRIEFTCEHCDTISMALTIAQHKGFTFLKWELAERVLSEDEARGDA